MISVKEDNQLIPNRNKDEDRFNNNTTVAEDFRSSDTKEVRTTNPGAINYQSTSQSTAQMNPYENNHAASWFPPTNMHTSTPINEESGRSQNTVPIASTQVAIKGIVQYSTRVQFS